MTLVPPMMAAGHHQAKLDILKAFRRSGIRPR